MHLRRTMPFAFGGGSAPSPLPTCPRARAAHPACGLSVQAGGLVLPSPPEALCSLCKPGKPHSCPSKLLRHSEKIFSQKQNKSRNDRFPTVARQPELRSMGSGSGPRNALTPGWGLCWGWMLAGNLIEHQKNLPEENIMLTVNFCKNTPLLQTNSQAKAHFAQKCLTSYTDNIAVTSVW